jgi:cell division protein FtsB
MEKGNKTAIILISIIILLGIVLIYGAYTGFKVKAEINNLNFQISQLVSEKNSLTSDLDALQKKYDLLKDDVFQLKKSCLTENACKGHFPGVRWYCNNIGDEVNNPSHTCVCDNSCNLNATSISY